MPIIQAYINSGSLVENAKWEINDLNHIGLNHSISIPIKSKNKLIKKWITSKNLKDAWIDSPDNKEFLIFIKYKIVAIEHLLHPSTNTIETMISVMPISRITEQLLSYIFSESKSTHPFIKYIQKIMNRK
jgi:hypothetical protein